MLANDSSSNLLSMFLNIQAKVKTAAICCEKLHDHGDVPTLVSSGIYATSLQLEETYEQMEELQSQIADFLRKKAIA